MMKKIKRINQTQAVREFFRISSFLFTFFVPFIFGVFLSLSISCSSSKKFNLKSAEGVFNYAKKLEKSGDYEQALMQYGNVKNKHPYSQYALKAELKIADIYYNEKKYLEAEGAYRVFKELHPKHPRIDYVTFRLGLSHLNQAPSGVDRDLSSVEKAIPYFNEVIDSYKKSPFFEKSKKKKEICLKKKSGKEYYIAKFYFKKKMYDNALRRFEKLLRIYPRIGKSPKVLYETFLSSYFLKNENKSQIYYKDLIESYPHSKEAKKAKRKFKQFKHGS